MLIGVGSISPYERQMLLIFNMVVENSPQLNVEQKTRIETKLQEIVNVWTNKESEK